MLRHLKEKNIMSVLQMFQQDWSECPWIILTMLSWEIYNYMWSMIKSSFICRVREMTTAKIGTLLRISGQVVRTHPVHPELVLGTFMCLDCRTVIPDVEQQFKFTQVNWYTSLSCCNVSGLVEKSISVIWMKWIIQ